MRTTLNSPITIPDGSIGDLVSIPDVPVGKHRFIWLAMFNSLSGNGGNGQLTIAFSDTFEETTILDAENCANQYVTLSPDGSALNGIISPMAVGIPGIVSQANVTTPLNSQIMVQVGFITLTEQADVELCFVAGQFDPMDCQIITDATLILEPV